MNERTAHAALDSMADWQKERVKQAAKVTPIKKMNDLDLHFAPGTITRHKREKKNPRLGLLICLVGALTVIGLIGWAIS